MTSFFYCTVLISAFCLTSVFTSAVTRVSTPVGIIDGFQDTIMFESNVKKLTKYFGIPYAEAPVGTHRFQKPVPKASFTTAFSANKKPPSCFQTTVNNYRADPSSFTEDCLYLNVYVPDGISNNSSAPVMIWIHGGAFTAGTSSSYDVSVLSTFGDVIVITVNYRLEMFGFLRSKDGALPGNQGLWDQQLAIQWVNKNIRNFGGNPNEVTIFGESAGAASVLSHALYPGNKGLFKRVIAQSGSSLAYWATDLKSNMENFAKLVGCDSDQAMKTISCLQNKSPEELNKGQGLQYIPSIDGDFIVENPFSIVYGNNSLSSAARSFFASLDIITGVNAYDGALYIQSVWAPLLNESDFENLHLSRDRFDSIIVPATVQRLFPDKDNSSKNLLETAIKFQYTDWTDSNSVNGLRDNLVKLSSDLAFFTAAVQTVWGHSTLGVGSTYLYEFALHPTEHVLLTPSWIKGANHADEIPFVGIVDTTNHTYTTNEMATTKTIMTMWTNFAKTGNPNSPADVTRYLQTTWPAYTPLTQKYLQFTDSLSSAPIKQNFHAQRMAFWLQLFPALLDMTHAPVQTDSNIIPSIIG